MSYAKKFGLQSCFWDASLSKIDSRIADDVVKWLSRPSGMLFLRGWYGSGKTYLMAAILNDRWGQLVEKHKTVRFFKETQLSSVVRSVISLGQDYEKEIIKICESDYLMIDDFGAAKPTEHKKEILTTLVDERYHNSINKFTVISSNLTNNEIVEIYGQRCFERLVNDACKEIVFSDKNYRRLKKTG